MDIDFFSDTETLNSTYKDVLKKQIGNASNIRNIKDNNRTA